MVGYAFVTMSALFQGASAEDVEEHRVQDRENDCGQCAQKHHESALGTGCHDVEFRQNQNSGRNQRNDEHRVVVGRHRLIRDILRDFRFFRHLFTIQYFLPNALIVNVSDVLAHASPRKGPCLWCHDLIGKRRQEIH